MANMSYCRFQNTQKDMLDCLYALQEGNAEDLSFDEKRAAKDMMGTCEELLEELTHFFEYLEENEDN